MSTLTETAVKANASEAQQLCQRGVAAARAGQKRVAAGLLTRAVRLDPRSEMAWLWLSGVLDDPEQQAFCLRSVLKLNPENQHALRGLKLLEQRGLPSGKAQAATGLLLPTSDLVVADASDRREAWWVGFRSQHRELNRARLLLWVFPIVLICLAIGLYESFALAVSRSTEIPTPVTAIVYGAGAMGPTPAPTVEPILEAEPLAVVESLTASYLGALEPVRVELRTATETYRQATTQLAGGSVGAVAATQRLRTTVAASIEAMSRLRPPGTLQQAHDDYLKGLELQSEGLDAVLAFYSGYDVANANRAALSFQEARAYIERARGVFAAQERQLAELSVISSQTAR